MPRLKRLPKGQYEAEQRQRTENNSPKHRGYLAEESWCALLMSDTLREPVHSHTSHAFEPFSRLPEAAGKAGIKKDATREKINRGPAQRIFTGQGLAITGRGARSEGLGRGAVD